MGGKKSPRRNWFFLRGVDLSLRKRRLLQKSTVSQSCKQDCPDFAERMKRKALRVRPEGSIPPYVTEAESRKQHSDSPLCNSLNREASSVAVHPAEEEVDPKVGDQHRHESDQEVDVQEPLRAEAAQRLAV